MQTFKELLKVLDRNNNDVENKGQWFLDMMPLFMPFLEWKCSAARPITFEKIKGKLHPLGQDTMHCTITI